MNIVEQYHNKIKIITHMFLYGERELSQLRIFLSWKMLINIDD